MLSCLLKSVKVELGDGLINEVNQWCAPLVIEWVTIYRRVNHLRMYYVVSQLGRLSLPSLCGR